METSLSDEIIYALTASRQFGLDSEAHCYAASSTGLKRSTDGGRTWQSAFEALNLNEPVPVTTVLLTPGTAGQSNVFAGLVGGLLRSRDGQTGWESIQLPPPPPAISALIASPNFDNDGILFSATLEDGVLWSSTGGERWLNWNFGLLDLNVLSLAISPVFAEDETLFAGTQSGIFRSTNGGRAWREVNLPFGFDAVLSLAISPMFREEPIIFAGTETNGLLRSQDGGDTWDQLASPIFTGAVNAILIDPKYPKIPDLLAVMDGSVLYSSDNGLTWQAWQPSLINNKEVTAVYAPHGFRADKPALIGFLGGNICQI